MQSQKEESENESTEHDQSSGSEEPEPGSVKAIRKKFEAAPSKKPTESKKEKSSRRSQKEESSRKSQKEESSRKSQKEESSHGAKESYQQDSTPSGPVQAARRKFEAASKKTTEGRKEEPRAKERSRGSHQEPGSSGPVQAMRQKYEDLSKKSPKKAPRQRSTGREQAPKEVPKASHASKQGDERPPDDPDVSVKRRKRPPSFAEVYASTPYEDRDFQGPSTDREPSGMDPEGMQPGVGYPKSKAKPKTPVAPSEPESSSGTYDGTVEGLSPTSPKQEIRTAQDEFYERWYHNNVEKVEEYYLLNAEIHHLLSQYMPDAKFDYDEGFSAEVLALMLKDFIENLYKKLRKANLEISETPESDISAKIHDHKRKALDAVSILEKQLEFSNNKIAELKEQISDLHMRLNAAEEKNEYLQQAYESSTSGSDQEALELLESRITESMSEKYEQELSRLTDESNEQRHENNELYEQLVALIRERVESEEQYMRDLSDAEQRMELHSMLKEALFSVLGYKEPNPQDARRIVNKWYNDLQSVISENQKTIDGLIKKCESSRKTKEQLMSHCVELEDEIENLQFEIQTNKQAIQSFLERSKSSSAEIENITEQENALKDKYQTKLPTPRAAATKRSFSPIENHHLRRRGVKVDLDLPAEESFELPPSSHWPRAKENFFKVNKRGFKPTTPREIQSSRPAENDSFDRSYIPQPHFASQGDYGEDESFSFSRRVSIRSPGKDPLDLSVGVNPRDISESPSGEHVVCDIEVNIKEDQNVYRSVEPMEWPTTRGGPSKRSFSPIENHHLRRRGVRVDLDLPAEESFELPPSSHWPRAKENFFKVNKRGFKPTTPREIQSSRPADRDSFDRSYIPQPHFASQGGYGEDDSFSFSRRFSYRSPGNDHSVSKTLSITSPGRDEPRQLNVQVTPRSIGESRSGEHVICQIDVNVEDNEQPIYEQQSKQRRRRRYGPKQFVKGTPPLTPSRSRDPRKGTPTSVFKKHHHGVRNIFNAPINIDREPRPRGNTSIEWEFEPSVEKWPGYVREVPQSSSVRSHVSTTPMNERSEEEEDESSAQWNE